MRCQDVLDMLSPYLDGALNPAEQEAVRAHLVYCPVCSAELEELRFSISLLQELPELTPPAGFRAGLMEKIEQMPVPEQVSSPKSWFERVSKTVRSSWYRAAAVAAVLAMTLGITSLWEKEGKQLYLIPSNEHVVALQEPQNNGSVSRDNIQFTKHEANSIAEKADTSPKLTPVQDKPSTVKSEVKNSTQAKVRKLDVESFTPQTSEGLIAKSATLKLDVPEVEGTLRAIGTITQNSGGSVNVPYSGSDNNGTIGIKIPVSNYNTVLSALQKLGTVVSYLPVEKDLSVQHMKARAKVEQLKAKQVELENKLTEQAEVEVEKQLTEVNSSLAEQMKIIKQLEERSTYNTITITII